MADNAPTMTTEIEGVVEAEAVTLQSVLVGFFCRAFLEGTKVGIAGHTSTQAHATAQKVKKGNTTQVYGEGDPEGCFCRSPGWRMRRSVRVGRCRCKEGQGQHEGDVGMVGRV